MNPTALVVYCGVLMSISAFSVDITLSSFSEMAATLESPYTLVQWTITVYMIGAGIAQPVWGSISDRAGRRPALASGLVLFIAGCLSAALAPTIEMLLLARAIQGFGAAAAIVSSRAIIRDRYSGPELARNLALATAIFAIGPILGPLCGAGIAAVAGWRGIFGVLSVFAAVLLVLLIRLPETIPTRTPDATRPSVIALRLRRLFAHRQSRTFLLLSTFVMSTMLLILASLPGIYEREFGVTGIAFAAFFASHGLGIIVGQMANRRLIAAFGTARAMLAGSLVLVVASIAMLAVLATGVATAWIATAILMLFATSYLIVFSNAAAMVLDPHGDIAGFAAAIYGSMSQIGSALIVSVLVALIGTSATAFAATLVVLCIGVSVAITAWVRRA